jgi:hypothetical protein
LTHALGFNIFCVSAARRSEEICGALAVESKTAHCMYLLDHLTQQDDLPSNLFSVVALMLYS